MATKTEREVDLIYFAVPSRRVRTRILNYEGWARTAGFKRDRCTTLQILSTEMLMSKGTPPQDERGRAIKRDALSSNESGLGIPCASMRAPMDDCSIVAIIWKAFPRLLW